MTVNISTSGNPAEKILNKLRDIQRESDQLTKDPFKESGSADFSDYLKSEIKDVDAKQKTADHLAIELATGRSQNIHETMLAATKAELSFNLMVQIRNKALEAYNEIMRMPV